MNAYTPGAVVEYGGQQWEITDVAGTLLGLRDAATGLRLTASLARLSAENPSPDVLGHKTALVNTAEAIADTDHKGADHQRLIIECIDQRVVDVQEVLFGKPTGAEDYREGYGPGTSRWHRAGLKAAELNADAERLRARDPAAAKRLSVSRSTLLRWVKDYEENGPAGLMDLRRTRNYRVTDRVAPEVLEACAEVNQSLVYKSTVNRKRRVAMVKALLRKRHPLPEFAMPGNPRLARILDELSKGQYLDGDALNRRSAATAPKRMYHARPAFLPGFEVQVDSTTLDVFVLFPNGKRRRPELSLMVDKGTHSILAFSLTDKATGADLAFMIAQALTPRPRFSLPDVPKGIWELQQRGLPWGELFDQQTRERMDTMVPLIRPHTIVTDNATDYTSRTVESVCQQFGITLVRCALGTPTDKPVVERAFKTIKDEFVSHLPGFTGGSPASRGAEAVHDDLLSLDHLAWLLDRWIVHVWQNTPTEALADPEAGGSFMSPNTAYAAMFPYVGFLPAPLSLNDYISMLPVVPRSIQRDGIQHEYRMYDAPELGLLRQRTSGTALKGEWEVHYIPTDARVVWVWDPETETYVECQWKEDRLDRPFSREFRAAARQIAETATLPPEFDDLFEQTLAAERRRAKKRAANEEGQRIRQASLGLRPDLATIRGAEGYAVEPHEEPDEDYEDDHVDEPLEGYGVVGGETP